MKSLALSFYWIAAGLSVFAGGSRLAAQSKAQITKQHYFVQTGATAVSDDSVNGPYGFQAQISGTTGVTDTFTPPGGAAITLPFDASSGTYRSHATFASLTSLNTTYLNGNYGISVSGQNATVSLTGDAYPNAPSVTATNGTWTGPGVLAVDPTQTLGLTANFTTNFVSGQAYIDIQVTGPGYSNDINTSGNPAAAQTTLSIPAGTIQAGSAYVVTVTMDNLVTLSSTAIAGYTVLGLYETKNTFTVQAQGTATAAPVITIQPASVTIAPGTTAVFNLAATGAATYQWYLNGGVISGATSARLILNGATAGNVGSYSCKASNSFGSTTSAGATLAVAATVNPGRLGNLSVLSNFLSGQILTVGFVTGGSGTTGAQSLLIRASGPTLATFGVSGTMTDPNLKVIPLGQTAAVASNDNWGTPATNGTQVTAADSSTGAFPLQAGSLDAALVTTLTAGGYSVQVAGTGPGSALTELYDTTPSAAYTATSPRLVNVSCNSQIAAGGSLTTGFVVGGTTAKTVLIRASGPTLSASFGIAGTMLDPQIVLHTTVNGADSVLAANAGWGGDPQITAAGNSVSAFPFSSATSKDSAILITLAPGSYTAVASSAAGGGGVALVEVYEIP
jgi:hypothetical protein